jgi:hypothetical protein
VNSDTTPAPREASGPFIRFCMASVRWLQIQIPADLLKGAAKLRKALGSSPSALRARLQHSVDFGTMSRS